MPAGVTTPRPGLIGGPDDDHHPNPRSNLALTRAVRSNALTAAQREQTAVVLGMIGSAIRTAAQAGDLHRGDAAAPKSIIGSAVVRPPVGGGSARLLRAVMRHGLPVRRLISDDGEAGFTDDRDASVRDAGPRDATAHPR